MEEWLGSHDDIAAVIIEPTGATFGQIPIQVDVLKRLRELTEQFKVLLIFDEVIEDFVAHGVAHSNIMGLNRT